MKMYKLTVIYTLDDSIDKEAFLEWRTTIHENNNAQRPGVIKTDCYTAEKALGNNLDEVSPPYDFITEAYYLTREEMLHDFFREESLEALRNSPWLSKRRFFFFSRQLTETVNNPEEAKAKLSVFYQLDQQHDLQEFIKWRTEVHEAENASGEGVIRTDCYVVEKMVTNDLEEVKPIYGFITECYYGSVEAMESDFLTEASFQELRESKWKTSDRMFLMANKLTESSLK
jgi:hypothetical protein